MIRSTQFLATRTTIQNFSALIVLFEKIAAVSIVTSEKMKRVVDFHARQGLENEKLDT